MQLWHTDESYQRIGDVIVKFSPFFKMYTEYVKNFDNAIHTINTTYAKNAKFAAIMDDIHVRRLRKITFKHNADIFFFRQCLNVGIYRSNIIC